MTGQPSPQILTFGCRLNAYESQVMADRAAEFQPLALRR